MLTLLLVVGLCYDDVCSYMDITQRMQVASNTECYRIAATANQRNVEAGGLPRYNCVLPAQYLTLMGVKPQAVDEPTVPRRAM